MKVAFYEKEITPPLGSSIPGYFNLRRASDVKDRLYARSVVFQNGDTTTAIVAMDTCGVNENLQKKVAARVEKYTGIKEENLVVAAIHTHTGFPFVTGNIEDEDPLVREDQEGYFAVVSNLIADCVILAYKRLEESTLSFGSGEVHGISFCRDYFMKNGTPRTNPPRCDENIEGQVTEIDPQLPVLFVKDKNGNPTGALISFGCHLDCVDGTELSGDYASILSKELKKVYGQDFVTVFLMSCSGNVNHFDVTRKSDPADHYVMMGKYIAGEALKVIARAEEIKDDTVKVAAKWLKIPRREISQQMVDEAKHIIATVKMDTNVKLAADGTAKDQYELAMAKKLIMVYEGPEFFDLLVQAIRIGDFTLFTMPGEPYLQFGKMIKENAPTDKYMVGTLCNRGPGYMPTRDIFYEGIYPARIGSNRLHSEAGYMISDELIKMAKSIF